MGARKNMHRVLEKVPLAYFITIRTYGTWLHGDQRGSVNDTHNVFNTPRLEENAIMEQAHAKQRKFPAITFKLREAEIVEHTVVEVCLHRKWKLWEVKARSNHAHAIVSAELTAERIMNDLKAWTTRRLRENGVVAADTPVWSEHGSTPHLWTETELLSAIDYVRNRQGPPLKE